MQLLAIRPLKCYTVSCMELRFLTSYAGKRICVAISGGMDSVALLHALRDRSEEYRITLSALTCEHGIRGQASLRDLRFVQSLCADWEIPLHVFRADVPARAKESGRGIEEEGRVFRYACFREVLWQGEADLVATAHHRDDLAETVLFRLIRGTALGGLAAIAERDGIVRPFLDVSKAEIEEYVRLNRLPYVTDESNADERYTRNFLRRRVLPALESVQSGAARHLTEFAERAKRDDEYLCELAQSRLRRAHEGIFLAVDTPLPLFTRACVIALKQLGVERDYTQRNIEGVFSLTTLQSGRRVQLPGGVTALREGKEILFYLPQGNVLKEDEIPFAVGRWQLGGRTAEIGFERKEGALYADLDAFPADCVLRTRRQGDVFQPYGGSRKKLKEFLTDRKIPARIGCALPLIASGNEILAIFGVEISDRVKTTEQTRNPIYLSLDGAETIKETD